MMKRILAHPFGAALLTGGLALMVGAALVHQANFGVPVPAGWAALAILFTVGLPTVLGVAGVAALWGGGAGLGFFVPCAVVVGLACQYLACRAIRWGWSGLRGGRGVR